MCESCEEWKHNLCEGITDTEHNELQNHRNQYHCLTCRGIDLNSWLPHINSRIKEFEGKQVKHETEYMESLAKCKILEQDVEREMGRLEKELVAKLQKHNIDRQAFHGEVFVGNHCKLVLAHHNDICSVLPSDDTTRTGVVELYGIFAKLYPLIFTKRTLDEDEIEMVQSLCWAIGKRYPVLFPQKSIPRKIHELVFDVPRFVQKHKTIGRFSEEEGESLHNAVNQDLRRLASVRKPELKLGLLLEGQELRGSVDRSLAVPKRRLCSKCFNPEQKGKERNFLKNGKCSKCDGENIAPTPQ